MSRKRQLLQEASGVTDTCTLSWDPFFEIRRFRNLAALPEEVRASWTSVELFQRDAYIVKKAEDTRKTIIRFAITILEADRKMEQLNINRSN